MTTTPNLLPWRDPTREAILMSDALHLTGQLDPALLERGGIRVLGGDRTLHIALDRPDKRNAQTPGTWEALAHIGEIVLADDEGLDTVVLTGAGASFSAGLDRRMFTPGGIPGEMNLMELAQEDDTQLDAFIHRAQDAFTWWREAAPVTIAAVQGHAIGAGFQLALACDLIVATPDAQFAMRETSYGLVPDLGGTWPLVQVVGYPVALELCATGRFMTAQEAYERGLVIHVTEDLESAVGALRQSLHSTPPGAVRALKPLLAAAQTSSRREQCESERRAQAHRLRSLLALLGQS